MIEVDNKVEELEEKVLDLFIQSIGVNHPYYKTNDSKMKMLAEFYTYTHFLYNSHNKIKYTRVKYLDILPQIEKLSAEKNLNILLLTKYKIKNDTDLDFIKNTLELVTNITSDTRFNINKEVRTKYKSMEFSILRKMKIKLLLK